MGRVNIQLWDISKIFAKIGATSFGGWSTTSLLLEKELVDRRKILTQNQLKGGVAYAQILPGATQVSIVSSAGYHLGGFSGALVATVSYLLPAISLITAFAFIYFHFAHDSSKLLEHLDGLVAALSGIILANAYKIGSKHITTQPWLWVCVALAFVASLWFGVNALLIILSFGIGGLIFSWVSIRKAAP
jgi:chromate transporter